MKRNPNHCGNDWCQGCNLKYPPIPDTGPVDDAVKSVREAIEKMNPGEIQRFRSLITDPEFWNPSDKEILDEYFGGKFDNPNKIRAIKLVRSKAGMGLKDAKEYVEAVLYKAAQEIRYNSFGITDEEALLIVKSRR